ncbi:hypothetical protein [Bilophila wadsworthia]|uniref:hypothetical protein n=1 Tax=Bilophila wadsworthia TaxID=35833 RepID=UPI00267667B9|nr:hypothetical protein [Bilophila wadsworthia]
MPLTGTGTTSRGLASSHATVHLVLVILAARRNKVFPRHRAASHHIHNTEGYAHGIHSSGSSVIFSSPKWTLSIVQHWA